MASTTATLSAADLDAVIFDLDGVITDTAATHAAAWKRLFDTFLAEQTERRGERFGPFEQADYLAHVDGKPRYDGVRDFLRSRGLELPYGAPSDPPDRTTVCGLGNRKDGYFRTDLSEHGAQTYPSSVALVRALHAVGIRTAIVSSSRNAAAVLDAAGIADLFEVRVDGTDADELGLAGKPDPALFLTAAERLGVAPSRAAVVEDAIAGVEAGRRGGFALVVGVDRVGQAADLAAHGADVVVTDLGQLDVSHP